MTWNPLDALVPNPAAIAARNTTGDTFIGTVVLIALCMITTGVLASGVSVLTVSPLAYLPFAIAEVLFALALAALIPRASEATFGPRGAIAVRLTVMCCIATAAYFGTSYGWGMRVDIPSDDRVFDAWCATGFFGAGLGPVIGIPSAILMWVLVRRDHPVLDRVLSIAPRGMFAVVVALAVIVGARVSVRWPDGVDPSYFVRSIHCPDARGGRWGWTLRADADEDNVQSLDATLGGVRLRARCNHDCMVSVDSEIRNVAGSNVWAPVMGTAITVPASGSGIITLRYLRASGSYWLEYGDALRPAFRSSNRPRISYAPGQQPPWGWLAFSLLTIVVAGIALRMRDRKLAAWSHPKAWRAARIDSERWIHFADGSAPRQAAMDFANWQGEVVVVPTAHATTGPFRSDGSPTDGWVIPGTIQGLSAAVRTARSATNAYALGVLVAGACPWVAIVAAEGWRLG